MPKSNHVYFLSQISAFPRSPAPSLLSSGDSLSTEKLWPLSKEASLGMRSRQCVGLSDCTAQYTNYEANDQTCSLDGLHFLLGHQMHSTQATERKSEDRDAPTYGGHLVSANIFNHLGSQNFIDVISFKINQNAQV